MIPDIQELKRLAEAVLNPEDAGEDSADVYIDYANASDPDTILALIEVAEAANGLERAAGGLSIAEIEIRQAISNTNWEVIQHWREKVRTALEGVKK